MHGQETADSLEGVGYSLQWAVERCRYAKPLRYDKPVLENKAYIFPDGFLSVSLQMCFICLLACQWASAGRGLAGVSALALCLGAGFY